ncbi:hypothetical protein [Ekhidna sp.]|uniref:hypothetical protein n=1 Tax=Ekhidna sp. TaxID=2608089 RepID=UPI003BAB5C10
MSKKETIKDKVKSLEEREKKIKLQLDADSDEMKEKAMRIGKIALITGVVTILGYWIFNVIFNDDDEENEKPKKKRKTQGQGITSRLTALAIPYIERIIEGVIDEKEDEDENVVAKEKEN